MILEIGQSYRLNFAEVFVTVSYVAFQLPILEGGKLGWGTRADILAVSQTPIILALGILSSLVSRPWSTRTHSALTVSNRHYRY